MADTMIKYITINETLYKVEEYTCRGYAGSTHTSSTMKKVPPEEVEEIREMLKSQDLGNEI